MGADSPKQLQAILPTRQFLEKRDARRQGGDRASATGDRGGVGGVSVRVSVCKGVRTERAVFTKTKLDEVSHGLTRPKSEKKSERTKKWEILGHD